MTEPPMAATLSELCELRELLDKATSIARGLEKLPAPSTRDPLDPARVEHLEAELLEARSEGEHLTEQLIELERRVHQMLNLYVSTYQLYAARDPEGVQATIAEIATDLLGVERFVLLLKPAGSGECRVALTHGFGEQPPEPWNGEIYSGGVMCVDQALEEGIRHFEPDQIPMAVVPLQFDNVVVGSLVLLELLSHKRGFAAGDSEVLDLLAAHAASALMASESFAVTSRKLQTLESLIQIARGGN